MGQLQSNFVGKYDDRTESDTESSEESIYVPPEILVKVFSYLNVRSRGRAAQVCRAWRDIAYVPSLWRDVEVSQLSPATLFDIYLRRGIRRVKSPAEPFDRENWAQQVSDFALYRSRHKVDQVEINLDLMGELIYSRTDVSLVKLLKKTSKSIKSLTIRYSKKDSFRPILVVVAKDCTNLVKLCLVNCLQRGSIDGHLFWNALRNLRKLRCLALKDFYGVDDKFFKSLADNQHPGEFVSSRDNTAFAPVQFLLTDFHMEIIYGIKNESIKYIGLSLPNLIELKLLYCDLITYHGLKFLSACRNLRRLTLWCPRILFHPRDWNNEDENGDCFPDLREGLSTISGCLHQLDSLIVVGCSYTSLEIMAKFSNAYIR